MDTDTDELLHILGAWPPDYGGTTKDMAVSNNKRPSAENTGVCEKKVKVEVSKHNSSTWIPRLRAACQERLLARGRQLRRLRVASSCSGLGTDMMAMKDSERGVPGTIGGRCVHGIFGLGPNLAFLSLC